MLCGMLIIPMFSADTQVLAADRQGRKNEIVVVKDEAKTGINKGTEDKKEEKTEEKAGNEEKPKEESVEDSQEKSVEKTEEKSEEKTSSSKEDENITKKKKSKKSKKGKKGKKIKKRRKKSKGRNKKNKKNKQKKNRRNRAKKTGKKSSENKIKNKSDAKNNSDNALKTKDDKNNKLNKTKAKKSKKGNKNKKNKKNKKGSKNQKKDDKKVNEEKNLDLKEEEVGKIPETDEYKPSIDNNIDLGNAGVVNENTGKVTTPTNQDNKENLSRDYTVFSEYTDVDGKLRFKAENAITLPESGYIGFIATGENTGIEDKLTWEGKDLENIKKGIKGNYVLTCITSGNVVIGGKDYGKLKFLAYIIVE